MTLTYPFRRLSIMHALVLLCINQHTKFEVPSFTDSKDMMGAKIKQVAQLSLTNPRVALHYD